MGMAPPSVASFSERGKEPLVRKRTPLSYPLLHHGAPVIVIRVLCLRTNSLSPFLLHCTHCYSGTQPSSLEPYIRALKKGGRCAKGRGRRRGGKRLWLHGKSLRKEGRKGIYRKGRRKRGDFSSFLDCFFCLAPHSTKESKQKNQESFTCPKIP